jgi:DNA repair exonuclease SbcCD ATPase subunit
MSVTGMKYCMCFFVLVLLFATERISLAQQAAEAETVPCKAVPTDFRDMADFKGDVTNEIALLEQSVKELPAKRDQARKTEAELKDTQLKIDGLKKKLTLSPEETRQLESLEALLVSFQTNLGGNSEATYQRELEKKTADLKDKKQQLQCVNKAISEIASP